MNTDGERLDANLQSVHDWQIIQTARLLGQAAPMKR